MNRRLFPLPVTAILVCMSGSVQAQGMTAPPTPTKHQMMKECMAKQKASDGAMPKAEMKKACKELTKTKTENAKAEKASSDQPGESPHN